MCDISSSFVFKLFPSSGVAGIVFDFALPLCYVRYPH